MAQKPEHTGLAPLFNFPLLGIALGAAITATALSLLPVATLQPAPIQFFLSTLSLLVLLVICIYALYKLFSSARQLRVETRQAHAISVCGSAFLGALFLSLIALLFSGTPSQHFWLFALSLLLAMGACAGFLASYYETISHQTPVVEIKNPVIISPPAPPGRQGNRGGGIRPLRGISPTAPVAPLMEEVSLPPPFLHDPLFQMPSPRKAFFFSIPKPRAHPASNQDGGAINESEERFALCDGASNSTNPRPWATLLARQWIKHPLSLKEMETGEEYLTAWLETPRKRWIDWLYHTWAPTVNERSHLTRDSFVTQADIEKRILRGAAATLLGLELNAKAGTWRAVAVGDTCLFHLRKNKQASQWGFMNQVPALTSNDFTDRPPLIRSQLHSPHDYQEYIWHVENSYLPGDKIILATDALAKWITQQKEEGHSGWEKLLEITTEEDFTYMIQNLRERRLIELDDTTLVIIPLN